MSPQQSELQKSERPARIFADWFIPAVRTAQFDGNLYQDVVEVFRFMASSKTSSLAHTDRNRQSPVFKWSDGYSHTLDISLVDLPDPPKTPIEHFKELHIKNPIIS